MKPEVGANPLWHGCLILSVQMTEDSPVQVVDSVGFYGITPCSDKIKLIRDWKKKLGLDIDLTGGYGELRHEPMRSLDKGVGLEGITFHISKHRFRNLKLHIEEDISKQTSAILEILDLFTEQYYQDPKIKSAICCELAAEKKSHGDKDVRQRIFNYVCALVKPELSDGLKPNQYTTNPSAIYAKELQLAHENNRKPRLKPFEFRLSLTPFTMFTAADSHTCKNESVSLLLRAGIPLEWQNLLQSGSSSDSIPRLSGRDVNAEAFRLHSTGIYATHTKRSGQVIKYREWRPDLDITNPDKPQVFWSLPPNTIVSDYTDEDASNEFINNFTLPAATHKQLSNYVKMLQQLHEIFLQSELANKEENIDTFLNKLADYIHAFRVPKLLKDASYVEKTIDEIMKFLVEVQLSCHTATDELSPLVLVGEDDEPVTINLQLNEKDLSRVNQLLENYIIETKRQSSLGEDGDLVPVTSSESLSAPAI